MRMKMKSIGLLVCWSLLLTVMGSASVSAAPLKTYVYDPAGLLTAAEQETLEEKAQAVSKLVCADLVILTVPEAQGGMSVSALEAYADDFYDDHAFGYQQAHGDGMVFCLDLTARRYHFSTSGAVEDYFTEGRFADLDDAVVSSLSEGRYADAFSAYLSYMEENYYNPHEHVPLARRFAHACARLPIIIAFSFGGSALITWLLVRRSKTRATVNADTYLSQGTFSLNDCHDYYIGQFTTRTPIARATGGGGAGHHTSGGGFSHGGHSGSF